MALSWTLLENEADRHKAWDDVVAACGYATFFHTRAWAELFATTLGTWKPDPVVMEFSDGNVGVLPLLRRVGSEQRQSMAPYVYGGPLSLRPPDEAHMEEMGKAARWFSDIVLYANPFSPHPWHQDGLVRWRIHTHVLDLAAGFDSVAAGFRSLLRRHIRVAESSGVVVELAGGADDVDEYYEAYLDSLVRWGEPPSSSYPASLFHALFGLQEERKGVRLWVGRLDGRVVCGVLVLCRGTHSVVWHAATQSAYLPSHASSLVYRIAIRSACEDGFRWFDFNPSGHLRGVEFFKERFGAQRRPFDMYHSATFTQLLHSTASRESDAVASSGVDESSVDRDDS